MVSNAGRLTIILIDLYCKSLSCFKAKMKRLLPAILLFVFQNCFGQEEFIEPSHFLTRFSFVQFTGGVIVLQARLDDFPDTLNFILDSGSGGISLDSMTSAYFNLKGVPSDKTI